MSAPARTEPSRSTELIRLRPVVHASATPDGVHVRGWSSSVTIAGSDAIWRVWQALEARLADRCTAQELHRLSSKPEVQAVIDTVLAQLTEHDMLVAVPAGWADDGPPPQIAAWLESVSADPASAWRRLDGAGVSVCGGGVLAAPAARALQTVGLTVRADPGPGPLLLSSGEVRVHAEADDSVGFVLPAHDRAGPDDAGRVRARLGLGDGAAGSVLAAMLGGAAANRLLCLLAGLPDGGGPEPTVFVARLDPLRAAYHPCALPAAPARSDLDSALARLSVAVDTETGPLAEIDVYDLPQVPAGLACIELPGGRRIGAVGATTDAARLLAGVGAAEVAEGLPAMSGGCDGLESAGRWLRARVGPGALVPDDAWAQFAPARRWWKALTLRLGVAGELRLETVAAGVYRAEVTCGSQLLGVAVEAEPGDAAAFAALAAVGTVQWTRSGRPAALRFVSPCGAAPEPQEPPLDWQNRSWTWPAGTRSAEKDFQLRLQQLLGASPPPVRSRAGHVLLGTS